MSGEYLDSSFSLPCPPGLDIAPEVIRPFSSNNLKVDRSLFTLSLCLFGLSLNALSSLL